MKLIKKVDIICLFRLNSTKFHLFLNYFWSLLIHFDLFDIIWFRINQICHNSLIRFQEFGLKMLIKRQFESDLKWNLGLSQFNRLSLPDSKTFASKWHNWVSFMKSFIMSPRNTLNYITGVSTLNPRYTQFKSAQKMFRQ